MNEMTPPKLIPCAHSKLANGMFPPEQTKDKIAMIGPTAAFSIRRNKGLPLSTKSDFHQSDGTSAAKNPAIRNPASSSFQSISQSAQNALAKADHFVAFPKWS